MRGRLGAAGHRDRRDAVRAEHPIRKAMSRNTTHLSRGGSTAATRPLLLGGLREGGPLMRLDGPRSALHVVKQNWSQRISKGSHA
jgi:hypothetical protein